jgi:hypothetical protein
MRENIIKKKVKYINVHKVTVIHESSLDLEEDMPNEIDFSKMKEIPNPLKKEIELEPDIAKYFKNSKQVNQFLRAQIRSLKKIAVF